MTDGKTTSPQTFYPDAPGWWWAEANDGSFVPVSVDFRGPRRVLSVCIPRCSTHCEQWWKPLKAIRGKWRGLVNLPTEERK